jgi:hypothetical protein
MAFDLDQHRALDIKQGRAAHARIDRRALLAPVCRKPCLAAAN